MSTDRTALTRRTFVASAGALGALAACGTAGSAGPLGEFYRKAYRALAQYKLMENAAGPVALSVQDKPELPTPARRGIALCHVAAIHEIPHGHPFSKSSSCTYNLRLSINPIGRGVTHKLHDPSTDSHGFVHENARA